MNATRWVKVVLLSRFEGREVVLLSRRVVLLSRSKLKKSLCRRHKYAVSVPPTIYIPTRAEKVLPEVYGPERCALLARKLSQSSKQAAEVSSYVPLAADREVSR